MNPYRLYQVDAFTTEKFKGNPAGVIVNAAGLSAEQMQAIARELNNSETAFILPPSAGDHEVWIRFFTPKTEVPSCGHATVAAHYVRALELGLPSGTVIQKIGAGILPVEIIREQNDYRIKVTQGAVEFGAPIDDPLQSKITAALDLLPTDLDSRCPIQVVSTGHSKVLVGIRDRVKLNQLKPDLQQLIKISLELGCNGYYVFVLAHGPGEIRTHGMDEVHAYGMDEVHAHGRMFAPAIGIAEDPVTGNANGPLGAYLVHHGLAHFSGNEFSFKAQQGEAMGRLGTVAVTVIVEQGKPKTVQVGGCAVVIFKTELTL